MNRHAILSVLLALALVVIPLSPTSAAQAPQACDQTQKLNAVDNAFQSKLNRIKNYESSYLIAHGRYFQALRTHTNIPDGNNAAIDRGNSKPDYQAETLQALLDGANVPNQIPNSFRIDQYDGANGQGYVIILEVIACGKHMMRSVNVGAETYRDQDWFELTR